jgi:hypothetical protein
VSPNPSTNKPSELLNFEAGFFESNLKEKVQTVESLSSSQPVNMSPSSAELEAAQIVFRTPSTFSTPSISTKLGSILAPANPEFPSPQPFSQIISDRTDNTLNDGGSLLDTYPPQPTSAYDVLLDLQGTPSESMGAWDGLTNLSQSSFQSFALGDLQGLEFHKSAPPPYIDQTKIDQFDAPNDTSSTLTRSTNTNAESNGCDPPESRSTEEPIVFQGRHSRNATPDIPTTRDVVRVDPAILDRAFRIFTLEGKSQKS